MSSYNTKISSSIVFAVKQNKLLLLTVLSLITLSILYILLGQQNSILQTNAAPNIRLVNSTADTSDANPGDDLCDDGTGACTLRAAIEESNANPDADTINFNIPATDGNHLCYADDGVANQVTPASAEPTTVQDDCSSGSTIDPDHPYSWFSFEPVNQYFISEQVTIDGYSQPGAQANTVAAPANTDAVLKIEIDTVSATPTQMININAAGASDTVISGINLQGNGAPVYIIRVTNADNLTVSGNYIGTDISGLHDGSSLSNAQGFYTIGMTNSTIGGPNPADRNVMSGMVYGAYFRQNNTGNTVSGNFVGVDKHGTSAVPNASGLLFYDGSDGNTIGGPTLGERNVISSNTANGIQFHWNGGADNNHVVNNYIGADVNGTADLGNGSYGVYILGGSSGNIIGTNGDNIDDANEGNLISGNDSQGVYINGAGTDNTVIAGNMLGTDASGLVALPNAAEGIRVVTSADGTRIGTNGDDVSDEFERNVVSGNGTQGIELNNVTNTVIAGNYIGVDITGNSRLDNLVSGLFLTQGTTGTVVGTDGIGSSTGDTAERNVISGNTGDNVVLSVAGTANNTIAGNYIGVGEDGTTALGATSDGISVHTAGPNIFGTNSDGNNDAAEGNVVSNNAAQGIIFTGATGPNIVAGNIIGLDYSGTIAAGNGSYGVYNDNTADTRIGTDADGNSDEDERNIISSNLHGVTLINAGSTDGVIAGNYVGTDITGMLDLGNANDGVLLANPSSDARVGTNGDGVNDELERNIIAGNNRHGVYAYGGTTSNHIAGNYIGVAEDGVTDLGNGQIGVYLYSAANNNVVGVDGDNSAGEANERNVISGNGTSGIQVEFSGTDNNVVAGNYIGVDYTGATALGNDSVGVNVRGSAQNNRIGTNADGTNDTLERNIISNNGNYGVVLSMAGTDNNVVAGNYIGTDINGTAAMGNVNSGVLINRASDNLVGSNLDGTNDAIEANIITDNTANGVAHYNVEATGNMIWGNYIGTNAALDTGLGNVARGILVHDDATNNSFLNNIIFGNGGNGIDSNVHRSGTPDINDWGDTDAGANDGLNYPIITNVSGTTNPVIDMFVDIDPSETFDFLVQLYDNPSGLDSSGHGEGEVFIDSQPLTVVAGGVDVTLSFNGLISDPANISLTITEDLGAGDFGSTSEFSAPYAQYLDGRIFEDTFYNSADDGNVVDPGYNAVTLDVYHDDGDDTFNAGSDRLVYQTTTSTNAAGNSEDGEYSALVSSQGDFWVHATDTGVVLPATHSPTGPHIEANEVTTTGDWTVSFGSVLSATSFGYGDPAADPDGDSLDNQTELLIGTDPADADTDDDGLSDGVEDANQNGIVDSDETDPVNPDTDSDGLMDGTEVGNTSPVADPDGAGPMLGTDTGSSNYVIDVDPSTTTDPLNNDTDGDTILDGIEDANKDGAVDTYEMNPNDLDTDDDGLADNVEDANQDGVVDANETHPAKPDTDGDGLMDGTEVGNTSPVADPDGAGPLEGTDTGSSNYVPDADAGATTTDPLDNDSDDDGLKDGKEDSNGDGSHDSPLETDPNNPDTDGDNLTDGEEDSNANGTVDEGESDPRLADTDGDGDNDDVDICPADAANNCDGDNISKETEDAGPNSGDANNDGALDSEQGNVAAAPNPNAPEYDSASKPSYTALTLDTASTSCDVVDSLSFTTEDALASQDTSYDYPLGLFDFAIQCTSNGDTADITYILDSEYDTSDWVWRKYNPITDQFSDMSDQVAYGTITIDTVVKTTATFQITDGTSLDDDALANATILDPSGPAVLDTSLADTGQGTVFMLAGGFVTLIAAVAIQGKSKIIF